ncbi:MAG: glycosyltransferase family 4 protein [Deltaproteobacteria bacterium]|nr:glycosyltransferase family 4 protein [Deltaproteobacteria bacterium]
MRIGLLRFKYDFTGGAERSLFLLAQGLLARGHQVEVVTTRWEGQAPAGLGLHLTPVRARGKGARLEAWARESRAAMARLGVDTFLSLDRVPGSPLFRAGDGCHAAWLAHRAPYESTVKRLSFRFNPLHRTYLDLERRTLEHPDLRRVIAGSRLVARELQTYYQVPAAKLAVIYNGVDQMALARAREPQTRQTARAQLQLADQAPCLLFLGSGFERKGLAFALAALAHLPEAILLVAGKGRTGPYARQARRLDLTERVRFLGPTNQVVELLAAADALVLPTMYDPCSNACLEALAAGLPVVTTRANGASELVEEGVSGQVVADPAQAGELAEACARALGLARGFAHQVPDLAGWLSAVLALVEGSRA